jgi:DNA-binding response OmpR family regulator
MPTALIVEDHEEIGLLHKTTLEMLHFDTVRLANNGQAALDWLDQFVPDLIILDLNLPQVSGHYVYKRIRADARMDQTVVVVCSANNMLASALANELAPQDKIMMKPVGPSELTQLIKSL